MTLWFLVATMTVVAVALILLPFVRRGLGPQARGSFDLAVYRDQLTELARDQERGLVSAEEAATARLEIERRMLAAAPARGAGAAPVSAASRAARISLLLAAILGPAGAVALYLDRGSPNMPDAPFAARGHGPGDQATGVDVAQIEGMVKQLAAKMKANPDDPKGWSMLARSYMVLGKYDDAAAAFAEITRLDAANAEAHAGRGEALVYASDGMVTPAAKEAFAAALALDSKEPRARFYLGLARMQEGEPDKALAAWEALAADSPPDAPWLPQLREEIAKLGGVLKEPSKTQPSTSASASASASASGSASASATPAPKAGGEAKDPGVAQIEAMVDGLATKMKSNPDDLNGWAMLARSYMTLEKYGDAAAAYAQVARLDKTNVDAQAGRGEALVLARDGFVAPDAEKAFSAALEIDPKEPRSRFYLGLARLQHGEPDKALAAWQALAADTPADAAWLPKLREEIAKLSDSIAKKAGETQTTPPRDGEPAR
jgi:cytochrome c-type biogenesis protein CcmH